MEKRIEKLEKEVNSLRDELASLKKLVKEETGKIAVQYINKHSKINGPDLLSIHDNTSGHEEQRSDEAC